jgi:hypothetical protein
MPQLQDMEKLAACSELCGCKCGRVLILAMLSSDTCYSSASNLAKSQSAIDLETKNGSYFGAKSLALSFVAGSLMTVSALVLS